MRPYVVVVSGSVGSGKSTISAELSKVLGDAVVMVFDHYAESVVWPDDMGKWMSEGCDPKEIRVPRMKEDLGILLRGGEIRDPEGWVVKSKRYIVVEEPAGREREEMRGEVDFVVYVDTPQDVCIVRMVARVIKKWGKEGEVGFREQTKQELVQQLEEIELWIKQYEVRRKMYIGVSERVKRGSDMVVDGTEAVEEMVGKIAEEVRKRSARQT